VRRGSGSIGAPLAGLGVHDVADQVRPEQHAVVGQAARPGPAGAGCRRCSPGRCRWRWSRRRYHFCCSGFLKRFFFHSCEGSTPSDSPSRSMPVAGRSRSWRMKPRWRRCPCRWPARSSRCRRRRRWTCTVHDAVAADLVVAEGVAAEVEEARIGDGLVAACACRSRGHQRHEGLEGGARRIGAVDARLTRGLSWSVLSWSQSWGRCRRRTGWGRSPAWRPGQHAAGGRLDGHQGARGGCRRPSRRPPAA
jgi:hypothetical protein